jgi:uncharacterized membrane protein YbjE (DUF340 family)
MISKNSFDVIGISDRNVILEFKSKERVKINFSELNTIWIKKNKMSQIQILLSLLVLIVGLVFYILFNFIINFYILFLFFLFFLAVVKISNYKSYELHIILNNGTVYKKRIPLKLRYETITIINTIKKKKYYYKIDNENYLLTPLKVIVVGLLPFFG